MPVTTLDANEALPRSHCFVSVARGRSIRTVKLSMGSLWSGLALGVLLLVWLTGSSLYLAFHDDLVSSLMARQARLQYAYEDRIAALRGQVQHEASLALVGKTTLEGEVRDLALRAGRLEVRASLVAQLADKIGATPSPVRPGAPSVRLSGIGVQTTVDLDNPLDDGPAATVPPLSGTIGKPRPEASLGPTPDTTREARRTEPSLRIRIAGIAEGLEHVDAAQYDRLAEIGAAARQRNEAIRTALASAGLSAERFSIKSDEPATGGPFVPLDPAIGASPFGRALEALQTDLASASGMARALPRLPFDKPLQRPMEVTSPFGARLDPFLGRAAMHTGVDLREDYGSDVRATAAGRVVSAGTVGGYGEMIEVDHGHGLSTRYAHLSSVGVAPGQIVTKGEVIGQVGATGRATGPHLHYETRIDGEAVDPMRFLLAGEKLAALNLVP